MNTFSLTRDADNVTLDCPAYVFAIKKNEKAGREAFELPPRSVQIVLPVATFDKFLFDALDAVIKYDPPNNASEAEQRLADLADHVTNYFAPRVTVAMMLAAIKAELSSLFPSANEKQIAATMAVYESIAKLAEMPKSEKIAERIEAHCTKSTLIKSVVAALLARDTRAKVLAVDEVL